MREIRILPAVLQDIADAADWYDENGYIGLGSRFIETFYLSLSHIQRDGEIHRTTYQDFRKVLIRDFPYIIFFRLYSDTWIISLVIHGARHPRLTRRLLRTRKNTEQSA